MPDSQHVHISLRTGQLHIEIEPSRIPLHRLLGFASRINSKRGFLLISKLLGKHYPVRPRLMAWSYRALARKTLNTQPALAHESSLWIGMAETATGLGYGVFAAAYALGLQIPLFMQTTRYALAGCERLALVEAHSHAADFYLYYPIAAEKKRLFLHAEHLVLVDDEISTGATFARLIAAYRAVNPRLKTVTIVSLVNFASAEHRRNLVSNAPIPLHCVALLHGKLTFAEHASPEHFQDKQINVIGNGADKTALLAWPGRLGISEPLTFADSAIDECVALLPTEAHQRQKPLLVLGSGECNPPAFLLGRALELRGFKVVVQATTRSPIYPEGDIRCCLRLFDNYQDGIDNFLYNVNSADYAQIIVCHETPTQTPRRAPDKTKPCFVNFMRQLNAIAAHCSFSGSAHADIRFYRP